MVTITSQSKQTRNVQSSTGRNHGEGPSPRRSTFTMAGRAGPQACPLPDAPPHRACPREARGRSRDAQHGLRQHHCNQRRTVLPRQRGDRTQDPERDPLERGACPRSRTRREATSAGASVSAGQFMNGRARRGAQALRVGASFRNAVNPSMEAAGGTSLFRTLRNEAPTHNACA